MAENVGAAPHTRGLCSALLLCATRVFRRGDGNRGGATVPEKGVICPLKGIYRTRDLMYNVNVIDIQKG